MEWTQRNENQVREHREKDEKALELEINNLTKFSGSNGGKLPGKHFQFSASFFSCFSPSLSLSPFLYFVHLTNHSHQVALLLARTMGTMAISHHTSLEFPSLLVFLGEEVNEGHEGRNSYCGSTGNSQANH